MAITDEKHNSTAEKQPPGKPSFLDELKRRKIFRVAITYAVVSWLIIQVAATTFGSFGIPEWAFRFVVLMVLLGFPVAILLAWAFELTPDGVRKTTPVRVMANSELQDALNKRRNWYAIGMAAALPTLIFGTLALVFYLNRSPVPETVRPGSVTEQGSYKIGTVAVLPFALFSDDPGLRNTADGIQDEMLTILSEMDPLGVVSRTSTMQFSSDTTSMPEMGKILGADFIVEGSIQTVGEKYSITVQLIHASDDAHIWAQSFDNSPERKGEPLVFQKEMAFELAINIYKALEKTYPPTGRIGQEREKNIAQMEAKLQQDFDVFWVIWGEEGWAEEYDNITRQIDSLLKIDPGNTVAHGANAAIHSQEPDVGKSYFYSPEFHQKYYLILKRAYAVVPDGFEVNKHLGVYYLYYLNLPYKALPFSRRAVKLDMEERGGVDIYTYWVLLESLCATGQSAAAIRISEQATVSGLTNFSGPAWFWTRGHQMLRRNEEQLEFFDNAIEQNKQQGKLFEQRFYEFRRALLQSTWEGSMESISDFLEYVKDDEDVDPGFLAMIAFRMQNYASMIELLSEVESGNAWYDAMSIDRANASAWAYLRMGNIPLANSYFKGYLNELENSLKGQWMKKYQPDVYAAHYAAGNACMGNREEALVWINKALMHADPARQFEDYFDTVYRLGITYAVLGENERACELLDQILSSPSGYSAGQILIDPLFKDLFGAPEFETVIRKHADQLKDPAILETIF